MSDYSLFARGAIQGERAANFYGAGVEDTPHEEKGYPITPRFVLDLQEKAQDLSEAWRNNECEQVLNEIFGHNSPATSIYLGVLVYQQLCLRDDMVDRTSFLDALEKEL